MADEQDDYRDVYRSARIGLSFLDDRLTEPQRDAILREATRTARRKQSFWAGVGFTGVLVIYFVFNAFPSIQPYKWIAVVAYVGMSIITAYVRRHISRTELLPKEVMLILKRKGIRPPYCIGCGTGLGRGDSAQCPSCGVPLVSDRNQ